MFKKGFFIAFILVAFHAPAQQIIDKVIAVVGKYPLLLSDYETYRLEKEKETPGSPPCKAFEELLYSKLLLAQADRDSVVVSDAEVDTELDKRLAYYINMFGGDESKFEAFYGKRTSVFKDDMRDDVRNQLVSQKMRQNITGDIKLTPSEVRTYFNAIPSDSLPVVNTELQIGHIVKMPPVSEQAKKDARAAIESYRERVLKGESMSVLAALYSEDPGSAKNGGRYESVMRGVMVPEFEATAFRLKKGEISEVFETPYGYHFVELIARKGETVDLRHILVTPKMSQLDVFKAKLFLDSLQKEIVDGKITFEEAAKKFSDEKETKQNGGLLINPQSGATKWENEEISQMDQNLVFVFDKMNVGDVSTAVQYNTPDGKPAYRILTIISRTDPHKMNYKDDYAKLLQMATFDRQRKLIKEWIEKRSKLTYIKIDPEYNCSLEYKWYISN